MKFLTYGPLLRALVLASVVTLGACSKKDASTPATTYATTWTADGTNYTATTSEARVDNNSNMLNVVGELIDNYTYCSVSFIVPAAVGTYYLPSNNKSAAGYTQTVNGINTGFEAGSSYGGSGTITVTTFSATEVIGTFSYTGKLISAAGTGSITNGKFVIKR